MCLFWFRKKIQLSISSNLVWFCHYLPALDLRSLPSAFWNYSSKPGFHTEAWVTTMTMTRWRHFAVLCLKIGHWFYLRHKRNSISFSLGPWWFASLISGSPCPLHFLPATLRLRSPSHSTPKRLSAQLPPISLQAFRFPYSTELKCIFEMSSVYLLVDILPH